MKILATLFQRLESVLLSSSAQSGSTQLQIRQELRAIKAEVAQATPGNPLLHGFKVYSQADEDGIIEHLFSVIGGGTTFLEIGCGNGLENNSHYLLLKGWRGMWVDGSAAHIATIRKALPESDRLLVRQAFVDAANVVGLADEFLSRFGQPDFLSLDIDGNDLEVMRSLLTKLSP